MSRCFPYSPLGREDPLIESIKLQKEKEKAKKKDKKERRKDNKKNKENNNSDPENAQHKKQKHRKKKHKEISLLQQKDDCSTKATNDVIDHLERSGLTEEHGTPIQNPESPEGSHDSIKRRKLAAAVNYSTNGTILRIKLPMLQQINLDLPPLPRVEQKQKAERSVRILEHEEQGRCTTSEQPCFSGHIVETTLEKRKHKTHRGSRSERRKCSQESKQFNELVESWAVPKLQLESTDPDDQDWLFCAPKQHRKTCPSKLIKVEDGSFHISCSAASSFQSQACYVSFLNCPSANRASRHSDQVAKPGLFSAPKRRTNQTHQSD